MKKLKTYKQLFEEILFKETLFENKKEIRYISDGVDNCPVCGSDDYVDERETDFIYVECLSCDFDWKKNETTSFNYAYCRDLEENIIKGENIGFSLDELLTMEKIKQWNPELVYLSNGQHECPFCEKIGFDINDSDYQDGVVDYCDCPRCSQSWENNYETYITDCTDMRDNKINEGDIIDEKLFNREKYNKYKIDTKSKEFNI